MASRGLRQLKRMQFVFCDYTGNIASFILSGASIGLQNLLKSEQMANFVKEQEHLDFEFILQRNQFPYMSCTYLNGFVKDFPLRKLNEEQIVDIMHRANNSCKTLSLSVGRVPLKHNNDKVIGKNESIQGKWTPDLWNKGPEHELEWVRKPQLPPLEYKEENWPFYDKKKKLHPRVNHDKKKIRDDFPNKNQF